MTIRDVKIGDFCLVGDGAHSSIKRTDIGIMYLSSKNFSKDGITLDKVDYISNVDYEKYFKGSSQALTKPKKDDLIFSIIGSIGGVYLYKKDDCFGLSSSVAMIRVNSVELDAHYLFFYLKSNFLQQWAEIIKSGSAQGFLSLSMIRSLPLLLPPLKTQQKIASILSNYDKFIENNTQRIKLLESMAEELYKEWFVRLRFPGYEDVEVVDGLPVGWERKSLAEICKFFNGKTSSISDFGKYPVYGANGSIGKSDEYNYENIIIIGRVGVYCGSVFHVKEKCWATDNTIIVKPNQSHILFIKNYLYFKKLNNYAGGSAQPLLTQTQIKSLVVINPSNKLIEKFNRIAEPIDNKISVLLSKNKLLKQTRDLLLPRLMSGKLNVEDLDII